LQVGHYPNQVIFALAGESSVPAELKTKADRLFCEFDSINDANLKILDQLEALGRRGS